jgi:hypothetical protein
MSAHQHRVAGILASGILLLTLLDCRPAAAPGRAPKPLPEDPALLIADSLRALYVAAGRAVVDSALASLPDTAPACVSFVQTSTHYRAEPSDLQRLAEPRRRYIARLQCPRTYSSMLVTLDSHGHPVDPPPPSYVDPYHLEITLPGRWTKDRLDVDVVLVQGTRTDKYLCFTRFRAGAPAVACRHISTSLS